MKYGDEVWFEDDLKIYSGTLIGSTAGHKIIQVNGAEHRFYEVRDNRVSMTRRELIQTSLDHIEQDLAECVDTLHALQARSERLKTYLTED